MGIKKIFQQGMNEFKRQSALRKEKKNLSQKQTLLSEQFTEVGKKAWETKLEISQYGNSEELITKSQDQIDELNTKLTSLESQKQELETTKNEKNEVFNSQRKEIEDKKKDVDTILNNEKKQFKEAQKEMSNADSRIKHINKEEEQLNTKAAAAETPQEEKNEIPKKLETLKTEKDQLQEKWNTASATVKTTEEKIKPLEDESAKYQGEIDQIKNEQKQVIGELDESLAKVNKETTDNNRDLTEITKDQDKNFENLGEKITSAGVTDEAVAPELEAANITKKEIEDVEVSVQSLDQQGTSASRSAFWKMIGLIAAGVAAVVIIILLLSMLFGGKKSPEEELVSVLTRGGKNITQEQAAVIKEIGKEMVEQKMKEEAETDLEESGEDDDQAPKTPEEAMKKMNEMTGIIKEQSEQMAGKKIVTADKATLMAVLPDIAGWNQENTSFNKRSFGQLEYADLQTTYKGPEGREIRVHISDTAAASAMLRMYRMFFSMNMTKEDDDGYEKISTHGNMRVIEKFRKNPPNGSFVFIVKDRYLVELKAEGKEPIDRLKEFLPRLDLSKLE